MRRLKLHSEAQQEWARGRRHSSSTLLATFYSRPTFCAQRSDRRGIFQARVWHLPNTKLFGAGTPIWGLALHDTWEMVTRTSQGRKGWLNRAKSGSRINRSTMRMARMATSTEFSFSFPPGSDFRDEIVQQYVQVSKTLSAYQIEKLNRHP